MEKTGSKPIDPLVEEAVQGSGTAFTQLWDTNILQLRTYLRSWLKNIDDFTVDDICSRSFEKAFRQIGSFDAEKAQFATWLRSIAHNTALDVLDSEGRAHPRNLTVSLDDSTGGRAAENIQDNVDTPLDSIIRAESQEATETAIEGLPDLYREIARKRLVDGMQYKEIALAMDMELNTVRTRIRRAKMLIDEMRKEAEK